MHEPIDQYPPGHVLGSTRLARGREIVDITRIKCGSMTTFVERVRHSCRFGQIQTAFRRTDWFPSDKIADRFITAWLGGIVDNRKYRVLHRDPNFLGGA